MLLFNIRWGGNMSFQLHIRSDDVQFCEEFLKVMATEDMCELFKYTHWNTDENNQKLWEFLETRLTEFNFPKPDGISIRQAV